MMYGEAILFGHARRLLEGMPLYQPVQSLPFTVTTYTPLFYGVAAVLQAWFGPNFFAGRALAFGATLVAGGLVGLLAAGRPHEARLPKVGGCWQVGLLASLSFLALGVPGSGSIP